MLKWEMYENYQKQYEKFHKIRERYAKRRREAGQRVKDLQAELEAMIRREVIEGIDLTQEKENQRQKIEQAEKEYEVAMEEEQKALEYTNEKAASDIITIRDLVHDWNNNYRPMVREKELKPIIERMAEARAEYLNAVLDYVEFTDRYYDITREMREKARGNVREYVNEIASPRDLPQLTDSDINYIKQNRKLPDGVERVKGGASK